eukprot:jgi/Tetstr1/421275/TSEL_001148.t1
MGSDDCIVGAPRTLRVSSASRAAQVELTPGPDRPALLRMGDAGILEGHDRTLEIRAGPTSSRNGSQAGSGSSGGVLLLSGDTVTVSRGRLSGGETNGLALEGSSGLRLSSAEGDVLVAAGGSSGVLRLRAARGRELTVQSTEDAAGVALETANGLHIKSAGGAVSLVAGGGQDGTLWLRSSGTGQRSLRVASPEGGVELLSGSQGMAMRSTGDVHTHLATSGSFRIEADSLPPPEGESPEGIAPEAAGGYRTCPAMQTVSGSPRSGNRKLFAVDASGKLAVAGGAVAGVLTLKQGIGVVSTPVVTRNSVVLLTVVALVQPAQFHVVASKTEGVGFEVAALDAAGQLVEHDGSVLNWLIVDALPSSCWQGWM